MQETFKKGRKGKKKWTTLVGVLAADFDVLPNSEKKVSFLRFLIAGNIQRYSLRITLKELVLVTSVDQFNDYIVRLKHWATE
jgi:hypothetical protein